VGAPTKNGYKFSTNRDAKEANTLHSFACIKHEEEWLTEKKNKNKNIKKKSNFSAQISLATKTYQDPSHQQELHASA